MGVIYLVRHGQADAGAYGIVDADAAAAPHGPGGLTSLGVMQATLTGTMLAGQVEKVTAAISGDLPRQSQTLATILDQFDTAPEPIVDAGWNEYALPPSVGVATADEYRDGRAYQQKLDAGLTAWITAESADPGGEAFGCFRDRVVAASQRARELAGSGQTVVVVSSAGTITQWISQLWDVPPARWPVLARTMINASVTKVLIGRGGATVVSVNEHAHLSDREGGVATFR
ncbi:histidine phosphatase family protein [Gordonia soli]|uniref:Phosphoglycerate mutase family protein n=1 Tax=Gordonia soli NBRC 108243 TaxID=1223545 RepID=M0QEP7_9ACTN|nr:histidine phosphatase family protein [Gordonia soli]GAC67075.1 hypothetical protein GS4_05_02880 [Gordonia soli NBRC 108243]